MSLSTWTPTSMRKAVLFALGLCVCVYAATVLWYAQAMPDVGIRCAFKNKISRVFDTFRRSAPERLIFFSGGHIRKEALPPGFVPDEGDFIVQLGDRNVTTWPVFLRALADLSKPSTVHPPTLRNVDDEEWVYIRFERPAAASSENISYGCWWNLGHLPAEELIPSIAWFLLKLGLFAVGALVFWKRPSDHSAALFFFLCIVTVGAYMGGYHWTRIATQPGLLLVFIVCGVLLPPASLHFYLSFPQPKAFLPSNPWKTALLIYGLPGVFLVVLIISYFRLRACVHAGAADPEINAAWDLLGLEISSYLVMGGLCYVFSVGCLVHSFCNARDITERNQVKWILGGSLLALLPIGYALYLVLCRPRAFSAGEATWPMFAASVCFTVAFSISITRYRLMQLDQIVSSGAVYFAISIAAALIYYGVVFTGMLAASLIGTRFVPRTSLSQAIGVSTTALILMLLLDWGRSRFKRALDRRFDHQKHQLDRTLKRMGQVVAQLVDPPAVARRLLQASGELLNVADGAVYLRDSSTPIYRLVGCLGSVSPPLSELVAGCPLVERLQRYPLLLAPSGPPTDPGARQLRQLHGEIASGLVHDSRLIAILVLGPKQTGPYRSDDVNLLSAFAQLTTLALASADGHRTIEQLNQELRGKIEKISEQQRRILALQSQLTRGIATKGPRTDTPPEAPAKLSRPPAKAAAGLLDSFDGLIGSSSSLRDILDLARKVAGTHSAILIRGESGTGKELLARAIHEGSPRADRPYVKVHCAALSPNLLESELFGHVKGAFTGAHRDKVGRFELANGGTLFLDEIGDISLDMQTKLLQVLQEKRFERVGSAQSLQIDVRIIAATHQNLEAAMREGRFREDLYYRLNVIEMMLPPLRSRKEDIPELALHFLSIYARQCGKPVASLDDEALLLLKDYDWPGNIRQLENVIERAVAVSDGPSITPHDLPRELWERRVTTMVGPSDNEAGLPSPPALNGLHRERHERNRFERERLIAALASTNGNKAEAARALGLARSTFLSRLKKHRLS